MPPSVAAAPTRRASRMENTEARYYRGNYWRALYSCAEEIVLILYTMKIFSRRLSWWATLPISNFKICRLERYSSCRWSAFISPWNIVYHLRPTGAGNIDEKWWAAMMSHDFTAISRFATSRAHGLSRWSDTIMSVIVFTRWCINSNSNL